ncbi:MAG: hypothetical protein IT368_02905 [Candidatus Hydrogenedentes bacterium]|nr:hypothetical protein [Candidatus Hydrogenedentota bacterium]
MKRYLSLVALLLVLAGCGTVGIPFGNAAPDYAAVPEEDLRAVAREIELAVQAGEREPAIADRPGVVLNEMVRQAIRTRAARSELVNTFRNAGAGWEMRSSLLKLETDKEYKQNTTRRQRDRDALLVMNENEDRWRLYEGIVKGSNYSSRSLDAIQAIFFEERVAILPIGQLYEGPDGAPVAAGQ